MESNAPLTDTRKTYQPFRRCIYCPPTAEIPAHLGDEHIIPFSFGGERVIPKASCRHHEKITTRFEDHCFKGMIDTARHHMKLRGRHRQKDPDRLPVRISDSNETKKVPIAEHPSALIIPVMPPQTVHLGIHQTEDIPLAVAMNIIPMGNNLFENAKKIGKDINLTRGFSALEFYQLIGKIAHSFAMAELGDTFAPYLINLIEGKPPMFASHFVGGGFVDPPPSNLLHEIEFAPSLTGPKGDELLQVRVRLFANLGGPNHYAIVGSRWKKS